MGVVFFDTAVKLKGAKFPQPMPAFGQVWYDRYGDHLLLVTNDDGYLCFRDNVNSSRVFDKTEDQLTFAPNATDILIHLGKDYEIGFVDGVWHAGIPPGWLYSTPFKHHHPAEAVAMAWLNPKRST